MSTPEPILQEVDPGRVCRAVVVGGRGLACSEEWVCDESWNTVCVKNRALESESGCWGAFLETQCFSLLPLLSRAESCSEIPRPLTRLSLHCRPAKRSSSSSSRMVCGDTSTPYGTNNWKERKSPAVAL